MADKKTSPSIGLALSPLFRRSWGSIERGLSLMDLAIMGGPKDVSEDQRYQSDAREANMDLHLCP